MNKSDVIMSECFHLVPVDGSDPVVGRDPLETSDPVSGAGWRHYFLDVSVNVVSFISESVDVLSLSLSVD